MNRWIRRVSWLWLDLGALGSRPLVLYTVANRRPTHHSPEFPLDSSSSKRVTFGSNLIVSVTFLRVRCKYAKQTTHTKRCRYQGAPFAHRQRSLILPVGLIRKASALHNRDIERSSQ